MQHTEAAEATNPPLDVVVVGEALTDIVTSAAGTSEHPGGSPANVAYGLGRLGLRTGLLTALGDDARGQALHEHLGRAAVSVLPGSTTLGRTASATVTLAGDGSASYRFDIDWSLEAERLAQVPRLIHTGSIATFLEPGASAVQELLANHRDECLVTYDPNIRPALLGSQAEARATFEDIAGLSHAVKLSDEDAAWLYPGSTLEETATRILGTGARLVVITRGGEGSLLATATTVFSAPSVASTVVDTIGAGDSYMAAMIMSLLGAGELRVDRASLESLGRTASMAAAITVRRAGANPPTVAELREHLATEGANG
ncbi:carbohydrate kinase family protein [Paeniglutamicibacter psychrophenolicus]|uniref:carbohydrate kinase family protein n=1 Tax=Paeniglutamicibacter psychrophenolicus TaxID=257454 RepID=UPI00278092CF|nr:carbohydrate kinase [Paeniglutamicibacter psychrophenolicus]MDQ0093157.1 fructokinase [Paeniglutamicibacter psychrophenolicus]